jgi:hypothetical protein
MDLGETGWCGVDSINLGHNMDQWGRLVKEVLNLRVP